MYLYYLLRFRMFNVRVAMQLEFWKEHQYTIRHYQSNCSWHIFINFESVISNVLFCDTDLPFQFQTFETFTCQKWWELVNKSKMLSDFRICHRMTSLQMLYCMTLTFLLKFKIWNYNNSKTVRASTKMQRVYRFWYSPSNGTILNIVLHDLDHFKGQNANDH